jgi:hypothetical protein
MFETIAVHSFLQVTWRAVVVIEQKCLAYRANAEAGHLQQLHVEKATVASSNLVT